MLEAWELQTSAWAESERLRMNLGAAGRRGNLQQ